MEDAILITNGKILTMAGTTYDKGCVLIEGTKIKEVGEHIQPRDEYKIIDAMGGWVMPGIIESHCHLGISEEKKGVEGEDCNETSNPVTPYLRGIDGINTLDAAFDEAVRAGVTSAMIGPGSANVVGGQFAFLKTKGRVIDNMLLLNPSAMKVAFGENTKKVYGGQDKSPVTRMATASLLRESLFNAKKYMDKKNDAITKGKNFDLDYKIEPWIPVLQRKIPLKAHVHRVDDILTAIRIAKEYNLKLTLDHCSEGYLIPKEIKDFGFPAIVGPALTARNKIEVQNVSFKTPGILYKEGVKISITTDHPVTPVQYLSKCAGFAVRDGLPLEEGLRAITINAAQICGVDDRVGSIEIGKDADIAIFDDNPMQTLTHTLYTIINGEIAYSHEHVHTQKETL